MIKQLGRKRMLTSIRGHAGFVCARQARVSKGVANTSQP